MTGSDTPADSVRGAGGGVGDSGDSGDAGDSGRAVAERVVPGVVRVGVGTGSPEGENGAYVLPGRGVVVDPGPPTEAAWERLVAGVEASGLAVDEVVLVLATHWHADHVGLAPRLAEAADATLAMHEADAPLVADYAAERERRLDRDAARLRAWGVPDGRVASLREGDHPSPMPDAFPVRELIDGERVLGIEVVHAPGHTLGGAAFVVDGGDEESSVGAPRGAASPTLLVGDHVLPAYTPNVGGGDTRLFGGDVEGDPGAVDPDNPNPLGLYLDALDRLVDRADPRDRESRIGDGGGAAIPTDGASDGNDSSVGSDGSGGSDGNDGSGGSRGSDDGDGAANGPYAHVLPGHGPTPDLRARAAEITRHHRERGDRVREIVVERRAETGAGVTPWAVARELFGEMAGVHAKMGAGEAAAHLTDLRARGVVGVVDEAPVRYAPVRRVVDFE